MAGLRITSPWRWILICVGVLVALFFAIQAWLSSGIGRGAVEARLSSALGRPARLEGDFSLRLLPRPGVSGSTLRIFTRDGRWLVLDAGDYLARLALFPLFRGELEVLALEFSDARADLGRLLDEPGAGSENGEIDLALPDIHGFGLSEVSLYFDGMGSEPYLRVESLAVENFALDAPAEFEAGLEVISRREARLRAFGTGTITVHGSGVVKTTLSRLDVGLEGWDVRGLEGELGLDLSHSRLQAGLEWDDPNQQVRLGADIDLAPGFGDTQAGYAIESFEFVVDGEAISGDGCLLTAERPALHLSLEASALDVEGLATLLGKWQIPEPTAADPLTGGEPAAMETAGAEVELPIGLAIVLAIDRGTFGDAVAEGATLTVGGAPACPDVSPQP